MLKLVGLALQVPTFRAKCPGVQCSAVPALLLACLPEILCLNALVAVVQAVLVNNSNDGDGVWMVVVFYAGCCRKSAPLEKK